MSDIRRHLSDRQGSGAKPVSSDRALLEALPLEHGRGVRLIGELDMSTAGELVAMLESDSEQPARVLDLADLAFMDMIGLHALERYARTLNGSGPLVLENVPPRIRRVFEIVGADQNPDLELRSQADGS